MPCAAIVAANTSMRPVEVKHLRRCDVISSRNSCTCAEARTKRPPRYPAEHVGAQRGRPDVDPADMLGHTEPEHYLWPACQWGRFDPTQPMLKWDTAWRALRDAAGLQGLRFHDLRHTVITELAEMGVANHVSSSIPGHLSRRMLEHYSHIRIDAKRQALDALDVQRGRVLPEAATATAATRRTPKSRPISTCPKASRHSHVTVWFCRARRLPVSC